MMYEFADELNAALGAAAAVAQRVALAALDYAPWGSAAPPPAWRARVVRALGACTAVEHRNDRAAARSTILWAYGRIAGDRDDAKDLSIRRIRAGLRDATGEAEHHVYLAARWYLSAEYTKAAHAAVFAAAVSERERGGDWLCAAELLERVAAVQGGACAAA